MIIKTHSPRQKEKEEYPAILSSDTLFIFTLLVTLLICQPVGKLLALPPAWPTGNYGVCDGTTTAGTDLLYQYTSTETGKGFIKSNWATVSGATSYKIKITSGPAITLLDWTNIGNVTSTTTYIPGISLRGAWLTPTVTYYVHIIPVNSDGDGPEGVSNGVQIAEKETWDGVSVTGLRNEITGGYYTTMWSGGPSLNTFYGNHYFESVNILANTTCYVQGFGRVESVPAGVSSSDSRVTNPKDGWLAIYANNITVSGYITASGRGYGGGGGGGAVNNGSASGGAGGSNGLGGSGGSVTEGTNDAAGGGGGSPGGTGGTGTATYSGRVGVGGGAGNIYGGGSAAATGWQRGAAGVDGGVNGNTNGGTAGIAGSVSNIGMAGTDGASPRNGGSGGSGEFLIGGAGGSSVTDGSTSGSASGGGGGGYGGGGSGGAGGGGESTGGGGGGGTGGTSGGSNDGPGGSGCGPYAGAGGGTGNPGGNGSNGGYASAGGNGDATTGKELYLGSGGGGGGVNTTGNEAGSGGGAGAGFIRLVAYSTITVNSSARLLANGAGGGGRSFGNTSSYYGGSGGNGAGGAVLLDGRWVTNNATGVNFSVRGGNGQTSNGGTIKIFAQSSFAGSDPTSGYYGRLYKNVLPSTTTVRDGSSSDINYSTVTAYLQANWDPASIRTSGRSLNRYEFKIGYTPYGNEVLDWISAGTATSTTTYQSLQCFRRYFVSVRAVDDTGFAGDESTSNGVLITDISSPTVTISSFSAISPTQIKVFFTATDQESGLKDTNPYLIELSPNADMSGATSSGWISQPEYTFTSLKKNTLYYFRARARDKADNEGMSTVSDWRTRPGNHQEKSVIRTGASAFGAVGDASWEYDLPVKSGIPLTVTAYIRYNTAYGSSPKPKLTLYGKGIATTSVSATGAAQDAWEQLTINAGTPSESGMLKLKAEGSSPNPGARFYIDDIKANQ